MKALVIGAGGSKSSFSVGSISYLLGDLKEKYDVICGVSSGAIITALLGMYRRDQEIKASRDLVKFWSDLDQDQIYKRWKFWGMVAGIWKPSLYDSTPLQNLLKSHLDLRTIQNNGRILSVGALSLNSGKYLSFTQDHPEFINATIASCSYPGMFLPVKFRSGLNGDNEEWFGDGGSKTNSPIKAAIDLGATHIDVIYTSPEYRDYLPIKTPNIISILRTNFDASTEKILSNDIDKLESHNLLAQAGIGTKKYITYNVIRPDKNLIQNSLDFNSDEIKRMIVLGYNKAKQVMENRQSDMLEINTHNI